MAKYNKTSGRWLCSKCKQEKEASEYYRTKDWCKVCVLARSKERWSTEPEFRASSIHRSAEWIKKQGHRNRKMERQRVRLKDRRKSDITYRKVTNLSRKLRKRALRAPGHVTYKELEELLSTWTGQCPVCGKIAPATVDHIIPLSKGGTHVLRNLQLMCQSCNSKKRDKLSWDI